MVGAAAWRRASLSPPVRGVESRRSSESSRWRRSRTECSIAAIELAHALRQEPSSRSHTVSDANTISRTCAGSRLSCSSAAAPTLPLGGLLALSTMRNDYVAFIPIAICMVVVLGIAIRWAIRQRKLGD